MEKVHDIKNQPGVPVTTEFKKTNSDIGQFLSSVPPVLLFVLLVISYTLILGLGNYIGYQRFLGGIKQPASPTDAAVAAVFGLLAFMMGFAFSSTWTRFVRRNIYVVAHAKAIGVCYLRTSLITVSQKVQVRKFLYEYTNILLGIHTTADLVQGMRRIDELHMVLWKETASLAKEDIDSELRSLFTASVNDLISLAMERKTVAMFIRIPNAIWKSLLLLALIGMLAFGYQAGVSGISKLIQVPLLPVAFGLVMVLIADLNSRDSQRQFKVTKRPFREVIEMMENDKS